MKRNNTMVKSNIILAVVLVAILFLAVSVSAFVGQVAMADNSLEDIVAPETGFNPVVHYEFKEEANLGKDSLGNYNLVAQNVGLDTINGGVALKNNGLLYAPALNEVVNDQYIDFSDLVKGSFSVSFRAYLRSNSGGGNYLMTSGSYGSHFQMGWGYSGLDINFANDIQVKFQDMLSSEFAWYRINFTYDESTLSVKLVATKEGDESYSYEKSETISRAITFGGNSQMSFTIGAQSHLGIWADGYVNAEDDGGIAPNISDFRLYSGVIDDAEIASIKEYDVNNAKPVQYYEANPIAKYEFNDAENIGKDVYGNVDLALKSSSADDYAIEDGALTLKNNNVLSAINLGNGKDIADYLDGFTIALDVKMANPGGGEFDILSTGKGDEALRVTRNDNHLNFYVGASGKNQWILNVFLDNEWQTIIVTGSISGRYMAIYVNKPGDTSATLIASVSDADVCVSNRCSLTFGGDSYFGAEDYQWSNPTIKNIAIYDFMFGSKQANQYLTEGKVEVETVPLSSLKKLSTTVKVDKSMTADDILACDIPSTVQATNAAGNSTDAKIVWNNVEKGDFSAVLSGFVLGVNNQDNLKVQLTVPYQFSDEDKQDIKPVVWYQFNDADNIGKDSMGNFDLKLGGKGNVDHNAEEGYVTFARENESYLYAPAISGTNDWADLLKGGYTFSYTVKADNTIGDGSYYAVTSGSYGGAFLIYGAYERVIIIYSAGGFDSHKTEIIVGNYKEKWVTVTVTVDPDNMMLCLYLDGVLKAEREIDDFQGFADNSSLYSFVIGGQATITGENGTQFFEGSIADVRVYDYVLSADNVKDLYDNKGSENPFSSVPTYYTVESIDVDTSDIDLVVSSENTVDDILAGLPSTVTVTNSKGATESCSVVWLGRNGSVIEGYIQGCSWANVSGSLATVQLSYVVELEKPEKGEFSEVKVNGSDYSGAALVTGVEATLSFKVVPQKGYKVSSVVCNGSKIVADENGLYSVAVSDYSKVVAYISAEEYKITYVLNNGEDDETQTYGYAEENVELAKYFTKEGYTFDGWYLNADLSGDKVESIDTANPSNITLYAKWVEKSSTIDGNGSSSGDNNQGDVIDNNNEGGSNTGLIVGIVVGVVVLAAAAAVAVIIIKKRRQNKE